MQVQIQSLFLEKNFKIEESSKNLRFHLNTSNQKKNEIFTFDIAKTIQWSTKASKIANKQAPYNQEEEN